MKKSARYQSGMCGVMKKFHVMNRLLTIPIATALLAGTASVASAKNPDSQSSSSCPSVNSLADFKVADNVAAGFSNVGNVTTYKFISLTNENPVDGLPGLVKYCVYPTPVAKPTAITALAKGADGSDWVYGSDSKDFFFGRPGGTKSDIPLDGKTTVMGTATWTTLPTDQTILLHIADPAVCTTLYGRHSSDTCFVYPSQALSCTGGDTTVAYNAIPFGGENCIPPSVGVEAYGFNELGDQVTLAGTARGLVSLNVLFNSYGCSNSGHWYSGDCDTTAGATFDVPITAKIYEPANCSGSPVVCSGTPLATVTTTQTIPYRPSADPVNCGGTDPNGYAANSRWFNPNGNGGVGACQYSIGKLLTFDFSSLNKTLPDNVVWTVAYNTSHSGYIPIGESTTCFATLGGCGYDSLNVGIMNYSGAPYAGTDVDNSVVFINWWQGSGVPQYPPPFGFGVLTPTDGVESTTDAIISSWTGYRPLGEIITK